MKEVTVTYDNKVFTFKGPLGTNSYDCKRFRLTFKLLEDKITITSWLSKESACVNTVKSHLRNAMIGVVSGYSKLGNMAYRHFPINTEIVDEKNLIVKNFLGRKCDFNFTLKGNVSVKRGAQKDQLIFYGINKEDVGQAFGLVANTLAKSKNNDERVFADGLFLVETGTIA